MIRKSVLILLAVFASACGRAPELQIEGFESYVAKFEQASRAVGSPVKVEDLVIVFSDQFETLTQQGVCELRSGFAPKISINRKAWDGLAEAAREALIFHEMGHCVLFRDHETAVEKEETVQRPKSVMNPYTLNAYTYVTWYEDYLTELFSSKKIGELAQKE